MDIFGIGPLEILFILIIALIVLGPKDIAKAGRSMGRFMRQIATSASWKAVQQTNKELRNLPTKLIREAGLEDDMKEIHSILPNSEEIIPPNYLDGNREKLAKSKPSQQAADSDEDISDWLTPPSTEESPKPPKSTSKTDD